MNWKRIKSYRIFALPFLAAVVLALSFTSLSFYKLRINRTTKVETHLQKKQAAIEAIALAALEGDPDEWIDPTGVEEDMVLYKYWGDSLVAWANTFPILNDVLNETALMPSNPFFSRNRLSQSTLIQASAEEQYMNLGSAWYVVRNYYKDNITIITGVFIKTDYPINNSFIRSSTNASLGLPTYCNIVPLNLDEGFVVFGKNGGVLFSILTDVEAGRESLQILARWLAIILLLISCLQYFYNKPCFARLFGASVVLIAIRLLSVAFSPWLQANLEFFSPALYASSRMRDSLASIILEASIIFLIALFFNRLKNELAQFIRKNKNIRGCLLLLFYIAAPIYILINIHSVLRSMMLNSSIVMELNKLDEINIYTIIAYAAFALVFISLLYCIRIWGILVKPQKYERLIRHRWVILYLFVISLYTLAMVNYFGNIKEAERNRVWAQKMAVTRDLEFEIQLKKVDAFIATDPILNETVHFDTENEIVTSRLSENYFSDFLSRYNMQITRCAPGDMLLAEQGGKPVSCYQFFHSNVLRNGVQLGDNSHFYFVNNNIGTSYYIGIFTFFNATWGTHDLYIELESHYVKDALGFPSLIVDNSRVNTFKLPYDYSYAKYVGGMLVANSGDYSYPTQWLGKTAEGYRVINSEEVIHYQYCVDDAMILITHRERKMIPYLVSLSYIFLFFLFFAAILPDIWHRDKNWRQLRGSFRRKISGLLLISMSIAMVMMALGSLYFALQFYELNSKKQIREKLQIAQNSMDDYFSKISSLNDHKLDYYNFNSILEMLSTNVHVDLNIYDLEGRLVRSSQPEIFERHLLGSRMNSMAFYNLSHGRRQQYIHEEQIGSLTFSALYAPVYNKEAKLVAFINVPYFSGRSTMNKDISSVIAAIVNIHLLLLLATLLAGMALSNQVSRPIEEISKKMRRLDLTQKSEHIDYQSNDELGELVKAYNQMVDDVEESSRRLAQTERERTWREMARQIAHEIKNPLTPMRLSIQHLVYMKKAGDPKWEQRFDSLAVSLLEQIDIVADAASEFSNFSKFFNEEPLPVELNALVKEQIVLFNTDDHIAIELESLAPQVVVLVRRTQIARVLVNIISNAVQALEHQRRGLIHISISKADGMVSVQIADNGPGVPDEYLKRLFTPNFTTKSSGTGLGLAISRTIIEQSNGHISYAASQWGGASFKFTLPEYDPTSDGEKSA